MKNKLRIICLSIVAVYLAAVIGITIYSRTVHIKRLPGAKLAVVEPGALPYEYKGQALIENGTATLFIDIGKDYFPSELFTKGSRLSISDGASTVAARLKSREMSGGKLKLAFESDAEFPEGAAVTVGMRTDQEFPYTLPYSAVSLEGELAFVNMVKQVDGPWGKEYTILRRSVDIWPKDGRSERVLAPNAGDLKMPLALNLEAAYDGMAVRLER
ncbi:MAG: hypothetical protein LBU32_19615 [Clostridiales bacterium]|nr:hypothetical protein [Clostridiales bacterium]